MLLKFLYFLLTTVLFEETFGKVVWKIRPQPSQIAKENENVKLNCEFETTENSPANFFVIWYKDGASQNVLALNDQLADLNRSNYEITGKYNLLIKNVTRNDSGQYTCQLFQSNEMVASVNLTVLVPPKYAKISLKQVTPSSSINRGFLVENDLVNLECCTNGDSNPQPRFEWSRLPKKQAKSRSHSRPFDNDDDEQKTNSQKIYLSDGKICNILQLNLSRHDNNHFYRCSISNEALTNKKSLEDNLFIIVEYKPEVVLHLEGNSALHNQMRIIENSSIVLFCNATAYPEVASYEWYLGNELIKDSRSDSLRLNRINRNQAGNYSCRCSNRHGSTSSHFNLEVLFSQITALNKTLSYTDSSTLRQKALFLSSFENSSVALTCEIKSNPRVENVQWSFYQMSKEGQIVNKITDWKNSFSPTYGDSEKLHYHQLFLSNLTNAQSGYYTCSITPTLTDSLGQTKTIIANATYYLQVQSSPNVKVPRRNIYANNFDQVELVCEVKSNPQSILTWFFGNKELSNSYKYNITNNLMRQINRALLDDLDNAHEYRSTLVINSLTQFDYGDYFCRANNIIGESLQKLALNRKQKPSTPSDFRVKETTSSSVQLAWSSPLFTGETPNYLITINDTYNLTLTADKENTDSDEEKLKTIELKGLQSHKSYAFKILAFNSMGSSEYSPVLNTKTLKSLLKSEKIPRIDSARYNQQSICFNLIKDFTVLNNRKDLVIKIEMKFRNVSKFHDSNVKSLLISMNNLKAGENCVKYTELFELDWRLKNRSNSLSVSSRKKLIDLSPEINSDEVTVLTRQESAKSLANNFNEFKRSSEGNISLCFTSDTSICNEKVSILDSTNAEFSTYVTLVAIGCSTILIFISLLIASICCCCCKRSRQLKNELKNDLNAKLVIKSFPIVSTQSSSYEESDASTKSSQQNIINVNSSNSSTSSAGSSGTNVNFIRQDRLYFPNSLDAQNAYDSNDHNKFLTPSYKIEFAQSQQNTSSIATVESDVSSSTSLENKTNSGQSTKQSSANHSPFTVHADVGMNCYYSGITSSSYSNVQQQQQCNNNNNNNKGSLRQSTHHSKPPTIVYSGANNIYVKAYQTNVQHLKTSMDAESGYSTPINNISKKLVYEVIV